jgi:3-phosphoshikimate 1-carboxyvinyltransferase
VQVEEHADGFVIHGGSTPQAVAVDAGGDHRIAMAMAVLGLGASGPIEVRGAEGIATSFPGFGDELGLVRAER